MSEQAQELVTRQGISLTLNGGSREMNSASIPIQWWLSEEVIAQNPKYIVFFEQTEKEVTSLYRGRFIGRRYVCKIDEVVHFLQLFSPGKHRLGAVVIHDKYNNGRKFVESLILKDRDANYTVGLSWETMATGSHMDDLIIASTVEEFEVPEDLFAKKPRNGWRKLLWRWVNLWYETEPKDPCQYHHRMLPAMTVQPIVMLLWWSIGHGIFGSLHTLCVLLSSLALFFFGFRPKPLFNEMWQGFMHQRRVDDFEDLFDVKRFSWWEDVKDSPQEISSTYKVWSINYVDGVKKVGKMAFAPWEVAVVLLIVWGIYQAITTISLESWLITFGVIFILVVSAIPALSIVKYLEKTVDDRHQRRTLAKTRKIVAVKEKREKAKQNAERVRNEWLLENLNVSKKTDEVHLDRLPVPINTTEKITQRFYVGFWTLKARVCKPFSS